MGSLITQMFTSFTDVVGGLAGGIKDAFANLIYVDPSASTPVVAELPKFIFIMAGVGLATGILYKVFGMIRARKGK